MKRVCLRMCAMMVVCGLVALLLTNPAIRAADEEEKEQKAAQAAVDKATALKDDAIAKAGPKLAEEHPIEATMVIFKPRSRGGIGVGPTPDEIKPDSIELLLMNMARRKLTPLKLKRQTEALIQMAKRTKVMAEITRHQPTRAAKTGAGADMWKKFLDEMRDGSNDMIKALEAKNAADIQTAAKKVNSSCINCHSEFRD